MLLADVADKLLNDNRLADTRAAVSADLAALGEGGDQVHHLDAGFQNLDLSRLILESRRLAVDRPNVVGLDFFEAVERLAERVEEPAKGGVAHRNRDGIACVNYVNATHKALGRAEREAANPVVADVLLNLEHKPFAGYAGLQRVVDSRHAICGELDVHHSADDLGYLSRCHGSSRSVHSCQKSVVSCQALVVNGRQFKIGLLLSQE